MSFQAGKSLEGFLKKLPQVLPLGCTVFLK
jgi:hypothetical protein